MFNLSSIAFLSLISFLLWRLVRLYAFKHPLDNIPGPASTSWWKGQLEQFFDPHGWKFVHDISDNYGPVAKVKGMFGDRLLSFLYVFDPKAIQSIIVKDQDVYEASAVYRATSLTYFGPGLVASLGDGHRRHRKMLNPVFSTNHLRHITPVFYNVAHSLHKAIAARVSDKPKEIDILHWMGRTALELVGQGGLGYSFDPLTEDVPNILGDALKELLPATFEVAIVRLFLPYIIKIGSPKFRRRILEWTPSRRIQRIRYLVDIIGIRMKEILAQKKAALEKGDEELMHDVAEGKDIISVLLKANMHASEQDRQTDEEVIGQMCTIVFAAMETTSTTLSRILQQLARHPDAQDKLRQEIRDARHGHDISYDQLVELPYLDAVCRETLRVDPPVTTIFRDVRDDIVMPLSEPIQGRDGKMMSEIFVPKGTGIGVAVAACNRNKAIWGEDAHEWKPERWLSPLPEKLVNAHIPGIYSNLLTFFGGGRACLGFQFSQLEMKVVLSTLIESYQFSLSEKQTFWRKSDVNYPSMERDSTKASMVMNVALAP